MAKHLYKATVSWRRGDGEFAKGRYSRGHTWRFDGGIEVPASASPQVVPKPYVVEAAVDPEEAFIASLSSCHMLTFLDLARRAGFVIESYEDEAEGVMEKNTAGKYWISRVTLRPRIAWGGDKQPSQDDLARLHHVAHEECFIANSVKTDVNVEGF
jgi:organic hydroperoxide reductase OsmC/OhrA